jgi:hypothetical protein
MRYELADYEWVFIAEIIAVCNPTRVNNFNPLAAAVAKIPGLIPDGASNRSLRGGFVMKLSRRFPKPLQRVSWSLTLAMIRSNSLLQMLASERLLDLVYKPTANMLTFVMKVMLSNVR